MGALGEARPGGFLPRIESLRGLAALLVAAMHASQAQWQTNQMLLRDGPDDAHPVWGVVARVFNAMLNGHGAVVLFFVISGFVLSLSLARGSSAIAPAALRFLVARLFRIYPAAIATVGLFALLCLGAGLSLPGITAAALTPAQVLRDALLLNTHLNGVMWSLQAELIAVPVIFAVFVAGRRFGPAPAFIAAAALVALSFSRPWSLLLHPPGPSLQASYAFMFGMVVPWVPALFPPWRRGHRAGLAAAAVIAFFAARPVLGIASSFSVLVEAWAATILVGLLAHGPDIAGFRLLDARALRFFGRISYSFYLLHPIALMVLWKIPETLSAVLAAGVPSAVVAAVLALVAIVATTPLAALSYRFIELPFIEAGRRLTRWRAKVGREAVAGTPAIAPSERSG